MDVNFSPLGAILDFGGKLIDRLIPDPAQKLAAQQQLAQMAINQELAVMANETALMKAQTDINLEEAKSSSLFKGGWRPFIGWVCGVACAWNWIGLPVCVFLLAVFGKQLALKPADLTEMWPLLLGMLGIGGLRTYEKTKGVAA